MSEGGRLPVSLDIESSPTAVRGALETCEAIFRQEKLTCDTRGAAQLVLAEALNNIVEHAYQEKPGGEIHLRIERCPDGLACTLWDIGVPLPNLEVPQTKLPDSSGPLETLPEGGFGWFLIRELTEDLTYERKDNANHLTFRLAIPSSGP